MMCIWIWILEFIGSWCFLKQTIIYLYLLLFSLDCASAQHPYLVIFHFLMHLDIFKLGERFISVLVITLLPFHFRPTQFTNKLFFQQKKVLLA